MLACASPALFPAALQTQAAGHWGLGWTGGLSYSSSLHRYQGSVFPWLLQVEMLQCKRGSPTSLRAWSTRKSCHQPA